MSTPDAPDENGSSERPSPSSLTSARRLREELSQRTAELKETKAALHHSEEALREERAHSEGLGRLLDDAYERLREAGLTDSLDFPVSRDAIRLYEEIDTPASFDEIMELATGELECETEEAATLLAELVEEGVLARSGRSEGRSRYVTTGHEPFF